MNRIDAKPAAMKKTKRTIPWRLTSLGLSLLMLTACAASPKAPTAELQAAELAISNADQAGVASYASPELGQARQKLTAARRAVQEDHMVLALRLAEQSRAEAELASAKTEVAKAKVVNAEMQQSIDTLNQEMQRNTGVRP